MSEENLPPGVSSSGSQILGLIPTIEPLTRNGYKHLAKIERLIRESSILKTSSLLTRVRVRDEASSEFLPPEVLVYFIRRAYKQGNKLDINNLLIELLERCTQCLQGKLNGFPPQFLEDMQQEVLNKVVEDLLSIDDRGDYAQVLFWKYFKNKRLDVCRKHKNDKSIGSLDAGWNNDVENQSETKLSQLESNTISPEQFVLSSGTLEYIPFNLRKFFILEHVFEMKAASINPKELTLSKHFGVSDRTIRTWSEKVKEHLACYLQDAYDD
jgi:hypothetical protein